MRVAFVTNRPAHYRTPIFRLLSQRHDVDFYFTATSVGRWWTPEHELSTDGLRTQQGLDAARLLRALLAGSYDCIVASLTGRTHLAAVAAAVDVGRLPLALWVELWEYPRSAAHALGRPLVRHVLRRADALVSGGSHTTAWIEREIGRRSDVFLLRNPVDNALFGRELPAELVAATRSSFRLETDTVACFVGRLEPEKGLPVLLHALAQTSENVGIVVVGTGSLYQEIVRLAADLGVADRVRTIGWVAQADLPAHYRACDFLVLPSITTPLVRETWGLVANEAMSSGLPVLATDAVGAAAGGLIEDGETGLVVPERDAPALAAALERLGSDSDLRARLGRAARARVGAYTFENATETFASALGHAIRSRRRP